MRKVKKTRVIRKKPISKASLVAENKDLAGRIEWATRIISTQQGEIDRLMKLNDKLTNTLDNFARRS
jgi:hypothetical protein